MAKIDLPEFAKGLFVWIFFPLLAAALILAIAAAGAEFMTGPTANSDGSGWAQAIGTVLAIVAGFVGNAYQLSRQKKDAEDARSLAGRAAYLLAYDALDIVSDRLESALQPNKSRDKHALRGARTTEMVAAMREFETARVPDDMLADFIRLRSRLVAINERISEIYKSEERAKDESAAEIKSRRLERLHSAITTRAEALQLFSSLESTAAGRHEAVRRPTTDRPHIASYPAASVSQAPGA